jgi:hypothetical protein
MRDAIEHVLSGEVTQAVRDSLVDGITVKAGDYIGLIEEHVVVAAADIDTVVNQLVARMLAGEREMLTLLTGEGQEAAKLDGLIAGLRERYPSVEIDVREGGQPYYPVLLAAE